MTRTPHGRMSRLDEEMIEDILETPIADLEDELRKDGLDPARLAALFRKRLAEAQDKVIQGKIASAHRIAAQRPKPAARPRSEEVSTSTLTLAARNADRPLGFNDPSVEADLAELRSEDWDD